MRYSNVISLSVEFWKTLLCFRLCSVRCAHYRVCNANSSAAVELFARNGTQPELRLRTMDSFKNSPYLLVQEKVGKFRVFANSKLRLTKKFSVSTVNLFLFRCGFYSPFKILFCDKIRQPNQRNPIKSFFMRIIYSFFAFLSPKSLKRRHDIVKISCNLIICIFTHFQSVRNYI